MVYYMRSASFELRKMNSSFGRGSSSMTFLIPCPTSPLPPVTKIIFFSSDIILNAHFVRPHSSWTKINLDNYVCLRGKKSILLLLSSLHLQLCVLTTEADKS